MSYYYTTTGADPKLTMMVIHYGQQWQDQIPEQVKQLLAMDDVVTVAVIKKDETVTTYKKVPNEYGK